MESTEAKLRHDLANAQAAAKLAVGLVELLTAERDELRLRVEALEAQTAGPDCAHCEIAEGVGR